MYTVSSSQPKNHDLHNYDTRNSIAYIFPPHHLTTLFSKKPTYAGAEFFNQLPEDIKSSNPQQATYFLSTRPFLH